MAIDVTYTEARANLAKLWDEAIDNREAIVIRRRGKENVVMLAADELTSLLETAYLLRSPRNAERLLSALGRSQKGEGHPQSLMSLKKTLGFDEA